MSKNTNFNIPVTIAGVKFRNPFYVASGPTTMTVQQLKRMAECGWGGASLKLTIDPEPYINRRPRYGYYSDKNFLSFTAEKRLVLKDLLKLIEQGRKQAPELVLFSNLTYSGDKGIEGWVRMAKACENAGVHINELNMCCPNMSFNVEVSGEDTGGPKTGASLGQNEAAIAAIVRAIKEETSIPLFVKITPEGGGQANVGKAAIDAGADAVGGNANRLAVPPINLDDPTRSEYYLQKEIGMACMNGEWLKPLALRDVYEMRRLLGAKPMITGTGGITTWRDAAEMMLCGADLIGICTATLVHGFGIMPEFIDGFRQYMKEKGYKKPRDMRDILVPAITSAPDLTIYEGRARMLDRHLAAPCTYACPNSVPAQGYVCKVADEDFEEAYQLIMSRSPLQGVCGKVCNHPCEEACTRGEKDEPIMIRDIKRFVIEMAEKKGWQPRILRQRPPRKTSKVAVIGSGPAGLACAYDLARAGHQVTVFEGSDQLGGMLAWGIPTFRLTQQDIDKEIDVIKKLGVKFRMNKRLGEHITIAGLKKDGFKAVFLGIGAQQGIELKIEGEDLPGSIGAVEFLREVAAGSRKKPGKRVAVIGGGFTAVDAARTAVRLGAEEVYLLYRRTRDEMPATQEEVREAEEEGVQIMYLVAPLAILGNGKVESIRMLNYVLGDEDESGRRWPSEVLGTEFDLKVDCVLAAISQNVDLAQREGVRLTRWGSVKVNEKTGATNVPGVYAGGDSARGPENIIQAIADGKRAAVSIDKKLAGKKATLEYDPAKAMVDVEQVLNRTTDQPRAWRPVAEMGSPERRARTFRDTTKTLTKDQAVAEAQRCLACGCGAGCEICKDICMAFCFTMDDDGKILLDEDACLACGMCIHRCPTDNIVMRQTGSKNIVH